MIPRDETIEQVDSKPIARHFQSPELAHAYILGIEDAKRALGAHRMLGIDPWRSLNSIWLETKSNHNLTIPDPPDLIDAPPLVFRKGASEKSAMADKNEEEQGKHLFAEATSRYDMRCIRCGCVARSEASKLPCTGPVLGPNDPAHWER
jgi:hypothetical protein